MNNVEYATRQSVAVLRMNNPPVNGLSFGLRRGLLQALDSALADANVRAVILTGSDSVFSAGADVREFGTPQAGMEPTLLSVIRAFDSSPKPVVAAISGTCFGGGFELALGCHWRVAKADASLGLPEVKLGLVPGAGGTQRLPRAIGLERALNMIVAGDPQPASAFAGTPLIDAIAQGELLPAAVAFAERVVAEGRPLRRLRDMKVDAAGADAYLQFARNSVRGASKNLPAPLQCVEAIAAAVSMPFEEGLKFERTLFMQLMNSPESRALRHVFAAERAAGKIEGLPADASVRAIRKVGVIGAGTMGTGIAMAFANGGFSVVVLETNQEALDRGMANVRKTYESSLKKGKLGQEQFDQRIASIKPTLSYDDFRDADLVIEAVFESMEVKQQVFEKLDALAKPGAILASNTSALD
ncbi:MAG TPA: enoyl-CoA hydratase-related protein, partial [Burkholderiaceae bacterium]|nr:enoyl-CoA hydratase-related protein [Burkholderiaceae bacterium]